ncbi:MAG TPA: hypothetical protein VJ866_07330 [Pyrinomonadaceae bacterium]|nr:hypothetical protein [Pyrinomonadaceae bacterium]
MENEKSYHNEAKAEGLKDAGAEDALVSPFCGSLRSKKFFMTNGLATDASHYLDSTEHCWCRETQLVVGPDGGRAKPARCVPGRSCYKSALGS